MALLVTLIVLLILAGISLSAVFSEKGIFSRAEKAGNRYNEAKAREVLETVLLADGQYEKHSNPKYNQDDFLDELIKSQIEGSDIKGDVAIVGEYAYELDRSVPKIGRYLGLAKDLIFPTVDATVKLAEDKKTATITITATEEKNGINKIEIWLLGEKIDEFPYDNIKTEITLAYTATQNGKYIIKAYGDLMASKAVEVDGILASVKFEPNGSEDWKKGHSTTVTIQETVDKIINAKYVWLTSVTTPEDSKFLEEQTFKRGDTITGGNETMTGTYYLWTMLTTQSGEKVKWRSEGFNFDNEGPTVKLESTPVSETSFTLTATASDNNKSGIAQYEFYVDGVKADTQTTTLGTATYTWNGTEMLEISAYVIVTDDVGNFTKMEKDARTKIHFWEEYDLQEKVEGYISRRIITDKEVMKTDNPMSWLHHNQKQDNIYGHEYSFTRSGTINVSEDGKRLIRTDVSGIKGNSGNVDWMWSFVNLREYVPFYFVCWGSSSEVGPDCGYQVNSIRAKDDNYYYVSGFEFEWVDEIPEGPKGNVLREISSIESGVKPINGKENNKWYKYIGTK